MRNPQETANTYNGYFLTAADNVIRNIKKDSNDPRENVNPFNYLINKSNIFSRIK
jgi:hypothetical protein